MTPFSKQLLLGCILTFSACAISLAVPPLKPVPLKADIAYGPRPHQLLDVYVPPKGEGPFPVLVWFGGLWQPSKNPVDPNRFYGAGSAVVAVQMRTMGEAAAEKVSPPVAICLLDARRAVQYVRLHAKEWNLDPERIAVGGGSQGSLPALYVGCAGEKADSKSADPVEQVSTKVIAVAAYRSQPTIDPKQMQEWVPTVEWGAPAFGMGFADSLKKRDELLPLIKQWSPDALVSKDAPPIFFENEWGLTRPKEITEGNYKVHSPRWALGFQKIAQERGATCYVKFLDHPSEKYESIWDFLIKKMTEPK